MIRHGYGTILPSILHCQSAEACMSLPRLRRSQYSLTAILAGTILLTFAFAQTATDRSKKEKCPSNDAGLELPAGFCASVFADGIGHARHLAVGSNGVVYANTWSGAYYHFDKIHEGGFLVALEDKSGAGKADVIERFAKTEKTGTGGTGIGIFKESIYAEINDRIVKYSLPTGAMVPSSVPETVVSKLPLGGDHPMHPFVISPDGKLYVDVASATNSCQPK